jgi:hypothetical protein
MAANFVPVDASENAMMSFSEEQICLAFLKMDQNCTGRYAICSVNRSDDESDINPMSFPSPRPFRS